MKKKILLVEKDKGIKEVIFEILTLEGFQVKSVSSTDNIINKISDYKPDAILIDIIRPQSEETEICRKIKAFNLTKNIPVIVLSTSIYVTDVIKSICADEAIQKPFDLDELVDALKREMAA